MKILPLESLFMILLNRHDPTRPVVMSHQLRVSINPCRIAKKSHS